jgi:hypothetical protein
MPPVHKILTKNPLKSPGWVHSTAREDTRACNDPHGKAEQQGLHHALAERAAVGITTNCSHGSAVDIGLDHSAEDMML